MPQVSRSPRLSPALLARPVALLAICGWLTLAVQAGQAPAQARQAPTPAKHKAADAGSPAAPLNAPDFSIGAPQGFGDRQNGWAWAMNWYHGQLYVGTNRAWHCVEIQTEVAGGVLPPSAYPPNDPDVACTKNYADLPLQAEIWRWTPGATVSDVGTWQRVYQAANDIPNPDPTLTTTHYLPEDIAYRGLAPWTDPSTGQDYLFASGVSAKSMLGVSVGATIRPRLLYTSVGGGNDGTQWQAVNQAVVTSSVGLDTAAGNCFRGAVTVRVPSADPPGYKNRFFIIACNIQGSGQVFAADNPRDNASFRQITPLDNSQQVFEIASYNGQLYLGLRDLQRGYYVVRVQPPVDAGGAYTETTVVPPGADLPTAPNSDPISMYVYKGRLYVGGNGVPNGTGAELIRIDPYDNWDVVQGTPRQQPADDTTLVSPLTGAGGMKYPLTGLDSGFGQYFNQHMWRMMEYATADGGDGQLYIGTFNSATAWKNSAAAIRGPLRPTMGFHLYRTGDGWSVTNVTDSGFNDMYNFGVRNMASTPYGLVVGSANYYYGTTIFRGTPSTGGLPAPAELETNKLCGGTLPVLSWLPVAGAVRYHIHRAPVGTLTLPFVGLPQSAVHAPAALQSLRPRRRPPGSSSDQ